MKKKMLAGLATGLFLFGMLGMSNASIISGDITGGSAATGGGSFIFIDPIPAGFTVGNDNFQDNNLRAFDEDQNIILTTELNVDIGSNIATGTEVASHYIVFDPEPIKTVYGYVEFDSNVLGILTTRSTLSASDLLANTDVTYLNPSARGLESGDWAIIDPDDSKMVKLYFRASSPGDCIRVLTDHSPRAVPVPGQSGFLVQVWPDLLACG